MQRRQFLLGTTGVTVGLAGCTADDNEPEGSGEAKDNVSNGDDENDQSDGSTVNAESTQEFPETDELFDRHDDTLDDLAFTSEEYLKQGNGNPEDALVYEVSAESDTEGTLFEGDRIATRVRPDGTEVWFTDETRVKDDGSGELTHTQYPDGASHRFSERASPPYISRSSVERFLEIAELELISATEDDAPIYEFESVGVNDDVDYGEDLTVESFDLRLALVDMEYIRSVTAAIEFTPENSDERRTINYEYEISDEGNASVSEPAFIDDATRVTGELAADNTAVVLEHTGGPAISPETELVVQDATGSGVREGAGPYSDDLAVFPTAFEPGDTAAVYWLSENEVEISVNDDPSEVGRTFDRPSESGDRDIYIGVEGGEFAVRFERRE